MDINTTIDDGLDFLYCLLAFEAAVRWNHEGWRSYGEVKFVSFLTTLTLDPELSWHSTVDYNLEQFFFWHNNLHFSMLRL